MNTQPLVSIICLCYNHKPFIEEAVISALKQSYNNLEIIVVDDFSTDGSQDVIQSLSAKYPEIKVLLLDRNYGNTVAFNRGFELANGSFIIDLATDDVLYPKRVEVGVREFINSEDNMGVHFTNAQLIDKNSEVIRTFYEVDGIGHAKTSPPAGDIYIELIQRFFICPPTMMYRRDVIERLNGYDETLHYEDFDFWIRSSRLFHYLYTDQVLVKRRILPYSHSSSQFKIGSRHMISTYKVCQKIKALNRTEAENRALKKRIRYEMKQCLRWLNPSLFFSYYQLLRSI